VDTLIAKRVLARFKGGAMVADPEGSFRKLRQTLDRWDEYVSEARKLQDIFADYSKAGVTKLPHLKGPGILAYPNDATDLDRRFAKLEPVMRRIGALVRGSYSEDFRDTWDLALTILQKYSLPTPLRKKIEVISRHWATKQKARKPKLPKGWGIEYYSASVALYLKYIDDLRDQHAALSEALSKGRPIAEGDAEDAAKVKAGPFILVNTGGFSEDVMQSVAEAVKEAAQAASLSGLGAVCYGEVFVSQSVHKKTTLAFYAIEQDDLFVRADAKASDHVVRTILHELGHRYEHKFLQNKSAPHKLYLLIGGRHRDAIRKMKPTKGDTLTDPKTKVEYEVTGLVGDKVMLRTKPDPNLVRVLEEQGREKTLQRRPELAKDEGSNATILESNIQAYVDIELARMGVTKAKINIEGYYAVKGIDPRTAIDFQGFITPYAASKPGENFAEMFAFYCMGDLPPTQAALFEQEVFG